VCVCYLKSFIAELCIFLLHSSCINSSIIALYDQQLPPSSSLIPHSFPFHHLILLTSLSLAHRQVIVTGCRFQVIATRHPDILHSTITTHTRTIYMFVHMRLISKRLRFLHALAVTLSSLQAQAQAEDELVADTVAAALKCHTCLVSKISVIHSVLPASSPTWSDVCCCCFEI